MNRLAVVTLTLGALAVVGCATHSTVVTEPPGLFVVLDGKDFGRSPARVESTGTTFGDYRLEIKDENGKLLHAQDLDKDFRVWGIFWPPYGIFYNLFELHGRYIVGSIKSPSGETKWFVTSE